MKKLLALLVALVLALSSVPSMAFSLSDIGKIVDVVDTFLGDDDDDVNEYSGMSFREAVDAYEDLYNAYINLLEDSDDSDDLAAIADVAVMLEKIGVLYDYLNNYDEDEITDEDAAYFLAVNLRVLGRLAEVEDD